MWRRPGEEWATYARRSVRFVEVLWASSGIPAWDIAVATAWWRWAGLAARLCHNKTHRRLADAMHWRNE